MTFTTLSKEEIQEAIADLPEWEHADDHLTASYIFKDFKSAFAFMTKVAEAAERLGHHPEWTNVYNRVDITLATHDADDTVTDRDATLAQAISVAAKQFTGS